MTSGTPQAPPLTGLLGGTPREVAEAGRKIAALLEDEAWSLLLGAVAGRQRQLLSMDLMIRQPSEKGAEYADVIGVLKGLAQVEPIARGIVADGQEAEAQLRAAEEEQG